MLSVVKPVIAWMRIPGIGRIHAQIDIPENCFDTNGKIIVGDAIEFVERWMTDILGLEYGVCKDEKGMPVDMDLNEAICSAKSLIRQLQLVF